MKIDMSANIEDTERSDAKVLEASKVLSG